uniref:Uncharacterized protein n=1 Tax=Opuntia streptacantha TaxID=393608 RepID=A0A7C9DBZ6_OPUST
MAAVLDLSISHAADPLLHSPFELVLLEILAHQLVISCMEIEEASDAAGVGFRPRSVQKKDKKLYSIPPKRGRIKRRILAKLWRVLSWGNRRVIVCISNLTRGSSVIQS